MWAAALLQPALQVLGDEFVVGEVGVGGADAVDLFRLARAQRLVRIEAPDPFQQALAPQDFVAAGDAAPEPVGDVEDRAVAVGDAGIERQKVLVNGAAVDRRADPLQQFDGAPGPDAPVAEQPAADPDADLLAVPPDRDGHREVEHDVVVVAGVDGDPVLRPRLHDAAHDVEGAVAVERRGLDGDRVVDPGEPPPEPGGERPAADRRLEVEPDQRDFVGDPAAMRDQLVFRSVPHRGEAEKPGVVAQRDRGLRLGGRLPGGPGETGDHGDGAVGPFLGRRRRELQHGFVEPRLADGELGRVDAHGEPARARVEIVAGERALPACIQPAVAIERQRMGRDDRAAPDEGLHVRRNVVSRQPHDGRSSRRDGEGSSAAYPTPSVISERQRGRPAKNRAPDRPYDSLLLARRLDRFLEERVHFLRPGIVGEDLVGDRGGKLAKLVLVLLGQTIHVGVPGPIFFRFLGQIDAPFTGMRRNALAGREHDVAQVARQLL